MGIFDNGDAMTLAGLAVLGGKDVGDAINEGLTKDAAIKQQQFATQQAQYQAKQAQNVQQNIAGANLNVADPQGSIARLMAMGMPADQAATLFNSIANSSKERRLEQQQEQMNKFLFPGMNSDNNQTASAPPQISSQSPVDQGNLLMKMGVATGNPNLVNYGKALIDQNKDNRSFNLENSKYQDARNEKMQAENAWNQSFGGGTQPAQQIPQQPASIYADDTGPRPPQWNSPTDPGFPVQSPAIAAPTPVVKQDMPMSIKDIDAAATKYEQLAATAPDKNVQAGAEQQAKYYREQQQNVFNNSNKLRDDFTKASAPFVAVKDGYNRVMASALEPTAAGDLALLYGFNKMLDPGSTVREGEFANAAATGGVSDRIAGFVNKLANGERLSESQRADFIKQTQALYKASLKGQQKTTDYYSKNAIRANLNPEDVVQNLDVAAPDSNTPIAQPKGTVILYDATGKRVK